MSHFSVSYHKSEGISIYYCKSYSERTEKNRKYFSRNTFLLRLFCHIFESMIKIRIHPCLPLPFIAAFLMGKLCFFSALYLFIFLHECAHFLTALALGLKSEYIYLLPWGCMLSLANVPSSPKCSAVFLSGPLFNLIMYFLNIFPEGNLSLALFNLIPVMPLDGGMIISLLFPKASRFISYLTLFVFLFLSVFFRRAPILPVFLFLLCLCDRRAQSEKEIGAKIRKFLLK